MATAATTTEELVCALCNNAFTNPTILQCDHKFCWKCLLQYMTSHPKAIQSKSIPCPTCDQTTELTISNIQTGDCRLRDTQTFICKKHEEQIKMYCKKCKMTICHICCSIGHHDCKEIVTIKEGMPEIRASLQLAKEKMDMRISEYKNMITERESNEAFILKSSTKAESDIKKASSIVMNAIQDKEKELIDTLVTIRDKNIQQVQVDLNTDKVALEQIQRQSRTIEEALKCNSLGVICDTFASHGIDDIQEEKIVVSPPNKIIFKWDPEHLKKRGMDMQLGQVYNIELGDVGRKTTAVLHETFDSGSNDDKTTPDIKDIVVIEVASSKLLVVSDRSNTCIKYFYIGADEQLPCVLPLDDEPFGLAVTGENEVLVTLPHAVKVQKIMFFPEMNHICTLTTNRRYFGIDYIDHNLLAACRFPIFGKATVDITSIDGRVLSSFETGVATFPKFVCGTKNKTLFVSEDIADSIIFISPEEHVHFKYLSTLETKLKSPRGITTTSTGDILIAGRDTNNVIQLTSSGEFVRELLTSADGIDEPRGICIDKEGYVYVACGKYVKVYTFQ